MHLNFSTQSSNLVFLTIILLSAHLPIFLCVSNEKYEECSKPFQCGKIQNVSYPFWGVDRAEYCGHPGLELTCQGEDPEITIMAVSYKVIEINMEIQAFTVARSDYQRNLCPQHLVNTTLNSSLLSYAWNVENLTLYYDCPRIANQSSGFPSQFNCTYNNGTDAVNYYVTASAFGNLSAELKDRSRSCHSNVIVPAFHTAVETIERNPSPETLVLPFDNGFGLKWDANIASKCEECNASGGRCGYNKSLSQFNCYCPDHTDTSTCLLSGLCRCGLEQSRTSCFFKTCEFSFLHMMCVSVSIKGKAAALGRLLLLFHQLSPYGWPESFQTVQN